MIEEEEVLSGTARGLREVERLVCCQLDVALIMADLNDEIERTRTLSRLLVVVE